MRKKKLQNVLPITVEGGARFNRKKLATDVSELQRQNYFSNLVIEKQVTSKEKIVLLKSQAITNLSILIEESYRQIPNNILIKLEEIFNSNANSKNIKLILRSRVDVVFEVVGLDKYLLPDINVMSNKRLKDYYSQAKWYFLGNIFLWKLKNKKFKGSEDLFLYILEAEKLSRHLQEHLDLNFGVKNSKSEGGKKRGAKYATLWRDLNIFLIKNNIDIKQEFNFKKKNDVRSFIIGNFESEEWKIELFGKVNKYFNKLTGTDLGIAEPETLFSRLRSELKNSTKPLTRNQT